MITFSELKKMRYMGNKIKVVFERPNNKVRFTKYFATTDEADKFTQSAKDCGMQMIERCELYEK